MGTIHIAEIDTPADLRTVTFRDIDQELFARGRRKVFDLSLDEEVIRIRRQIESRTVRLGDAFDISFGVKTGDDEKFIGREAPSRVYKPLLRGENVQRFHPSFQGEYVRYVPAEMKAHRRTARPGTAARFERPKVMVGDTGRGVRACYDPGRYYAKDVLLVAAKARTRAAAAEVRLKALTGILNSRLMDYYYSLAFPTLHLQRNELADFPLTELLTTAGAPHEDIVRLAELVDRITAAKLEALEGASEAVRRSGQRQVEHLEDRLNEIVFALYGLSQTMVRAVLRATGATDIAERDTIVEDAGILADANFQAIN